jgi:biotin-(acetyl-CoA carboxylase) ligase
MGCSARLNLVTPPLPGPLLLLEELSGPTGQPPDMTGANYIIELKRSCLMVEAMTTEEELMNQIEAIYRLWAKNGFDDSTVRVINGLFEIAKEIDPERMDKAFVEGTAGR